MLQKLSLSLFLAISGCASAGITSKPPKLMTCLLDPALAELECYDPITDQKSFLPLSLASKYTCFSINDMQQLLTWIKLVSK